MYRSAIHTTLRAKCLSGLPKLSSALSSKLRCLTQTPTSQRPSRHLCKPARTPSTSTDSCSCDRAFTPIEFRHQFKTMFAHVFCNSSFSKEKKNEKKEKKVRLCKSKTTLLLIAHKGFTVVHRRVHDAQVSYLPICQLCDWCICHRYCTRGGIVSKSSALFLLSDRRGRDRSQLGFHSLLHAFNIFPLFSSCFIAFFFVLFYSVFLKQNVGKRAERRLVCFLSPSASASWRHAFNPFLFPLLAY